MEARRRLTELAVRQAQRKRRILSEKIRIRDRQTHRSGTFQQRREAIDTKLAAHKRLKEDWTLGPLAPWREEVGLQPHGDEVMTREANIDWGTYTIQRLQKPRLPEAEHLVLRDLVIRKGDRVCVTDTKYLIKRGRDRDVQQLKEEKRRAKEEGRKVEKDERLEFVDAEVRERAIGKIGTVKRIDCATGYVTMQGVNMIDVKVPEDMRSRGEAPIVSMEEPVPYSCLRLVYPMPVEQTHDPLTGLPHPEPVYIAQDTLIDPLALEIRHASGTEILPVKEEKNAYDYETDMHDTSFGLFHADRSQYFPPVSRYKGPRYRYLMPQRLRIPWPVKPDMGRQDDKEDTLGATVEAKTFYPTLLRPPMPEMVIDELRNPHSRFRDRHDDEYVAKKEAGDEEARAEMERSEALKAKGARNIARMDAPKRKTEKGSGKPRVRDPAAEGAEREVSTLVKRKSGVAAAEGDATASRRSKSKGPMPDSRILEFLGQHIAAKRGLEIRTKPKSASGMPPPSPTSSGHSASPPS